MRRREKLLGQLAEHLDEGEVILDAMLGAYRYSSRPNLETGILTATSHRLVFFASRGNWHDFESFPYGKISSLEHGKEVTGGTLTFRFPLATSTTWLPPFTTVTAAMIRPVTDLPSFVALVEGQMREPSPTGIERSARHFELPDTESAASEEFIMRRIWERRFLMKSDTGWEMRRRAGSQKSVRYGTLTRRRRQGGYEVSTGGSETRILNMHDPLICEMTDLSGRRIATCEWGTFVKLAESRIELRTNIIFPHGPNFELRIEGEKDRRTWVWSEDLRFKGNVVADGSAGSFMKIHHATPTAALLLWWAVHRRKATPYNPTPG